MTRLAPLLLVACGGTWGLGGQDICDAAAENDSSLDYDTDGATGPLASGVAQQCPDTGGGTDSSFSAVGGSGVIVVTHAGYTWDCCAQFEVATEIVGSTINLVYDDVDDTECDCTCDWSLAFTLEDVAAGDWVVHAPTGETATATVTE